MATRRTLLLLRHAQTEDSRPGGRDHDRRLTADGDKQAQAVGAALAGLPVDAVLCSDAVRTRQTLEQLELHLAPERVDVSRDYYDAGSDTLLAALRAVSDDCRCALLIGHAPGVPALAYQLADPVISDAAALAAINGRFPAATLARLEFLGSWADLETAALIDVRVP